MTKNNKKNKKSLGRGLSALLQGDGYSTEVDSKTDQQSSESATNETDSQFQMIDIHQIASNPDQPRTLFDEEKLIELSQSIKNVGIIEPILLRKAPASTTGSPPYQLIAGERRWRAAKIAGFEKIPAIIKTHDNDNLLEVMLIENLQREDLTPLEEAQSYESIMEKKKMTQEELADQIGKSRSHIANMIRILKAPLNVRKLLAENKLSMSQVRTILGSDPEVMEQLAQEAVRDHLSVRELENRVNELRPAKAGGLSKKSNLEPAKDPNIIEIEELYQEKLKTKVSISMIKKKVGKLEIEYYHYDELLQILNRIQDENHP